METVWLWLRWPLAAVAAMFILFAVGSFIGGCISTPDDDEEPDPDW